MNQSRLVAKLIAPLHALDASEGSPGEVVMAALTWPTEAWVPQALEWIEQGVEIDGEISAALESFAANKLYSQTIRHKAFALAARWRRQQPLSG